MAFITAQRLGAVALKAKLDGRFPGADAAHTLMYRSGVAGRAADIQLRHMLKVVNADAVGDRCEAVQAVAALSGAVFSSRVIDC